MENNKNWKAIIVDDEKSARELLEQVIEMTQLPITVIDRCSNLPDAANAIQNRDPDIVFMDIEMPEFKGLQINQFLKERNFELVMTTAYDEYAIDALRIDATDYLLKPVDPESLQNCMQRIQTKQLKANANEQYITLNTHKENKRIKCSSISYIQADGMYSEIFYSDDSIVVSKPIKKIEEQLPDYFYRVHRSYLINMKKIVSLSNLGENIVTLDDGSKIPIAKKNRTYMKRIMDSL